MNITKTVNENDVILSVNGRLDTTTATQFEEVITENLSAGKLILDCKGLEYVSSAGLRVLLAAQKKTKGALKLVGVQELVMEVFEMTGFASILDIE